MNEEKMLKPALIGGVLLGILSSLPFINLFNCFCCAWVIGGGVLASYLYVKDSPFPVTLGRGLILGLLTGLIGTLVTALFFAPFYLMMNRAGGGVIEQIRRTIEQLPNMPPETRETFRSLSERGGMDAFFLVLGFVCMLITYSLAAMLGGLVGVALFEKRKPNEAPVTPLYQPPPNPPPPPDAP